MINLKLQPKRILYNEKAFNPGAHEGRFEKIKTKMTSLSQHKNSNEVSFDRMAKRMDLFETNNIGSLLKETVLTNAEGSPVKLGSCLGEKDDATIVELLRHLA